MQRGRVRGFKQPKKKSDRAYLVFNAIESGDTYSDVADFFKISVSRVRQLHAYVFIEMVKEPETFRENFLKATGFSYKN